MSSILECHILVVDDEPSMRELLTEYLGENDLRVTSAADSAEMRAALAEHAIDLVVLDLRLGTEDGMLLARKLREESAIPIIIVTGKQDDADRVMGLELGADDYITKPFNPRELLARIRAVLRRYQTATETLPARVMRLPVRGVADVIKRLNALRRVLRRHVHDAPTIRSVLEEAVEIFGMASHRLKLLRGTGGS